MGLFGWSKQKKEAAFVERAEQLAGSLQAELYRSCKQVLVARLPDETAGNVAAAIANYVCRFGYVNPVHQSNADIMRSFSIEAPQVLASFGDVFKANATGVLIVLAAAWKLDLDKFKAHLSALAADGFAKVGKDTPDVRREIPEDLQYYVYEATTLG